MACIRNSVRRFVISVDDYSSCWPPECCRCDRPFWRVDRLAPFRARDVLGTTDDPHAHTDLRRLACTAITKRDVGWWTFGRGSGAEAIRLAHRVVPAPHAAMARGLRSGPVFYVPQPRSGADHRLP